MKARTLLLLLIPLFASGCYESNVPITPTPDTFDPALVGTWEEVPAVGTSSGRFTVLRFNETEYYAEMPMQAGNTTDLMRLRIFLSTIDGATFANVQGIQSEARPYSIFKLERRNHELHVWPLQQYAPTFKTSAELRSYLQAHAQDSTIFGEVGRFRKVD